MLYTEKHRAFSPLYHRLYFFQSKKGLKNAFNYVIISFVVNIYNALTGRVGIIFSEKRGKAAG